MLKSAGAIVRAYIMYKPYVIFTIFASLFTVAALVPFVRFAVLRAIGDTGEHIQSLILGAILAILAFLSIIIGIISDLIRTNRVLIEDTLEYTKRMRFRIPEATERATDRTTVTDAPPLQPSVSSIAAARRRPTGTGG